MNEGASGRAPRLYKPTARECALLLLRLIEARESERGKEITRLRVAELSLQRLWLRRRILPDFVEEVAEWLSDGGFTMFFAGSAYAVIKSDAVESWPRVGSKRLGTELLAVARGEFDFSTLERLLLAAPEKVEDDKPDTSDV